MTKAVKNAVFVIEIVFLMTKMWLKWESKDLLFLPVYGPMTFSSGGPITCECKTFFLLHKVQGWEVWPHAHLNEKLKSINIC